MNTEIAEAIESRHCNTNLENRVKCDASRQGRDTALEQLKHEEFKALAFISLFLNSVKTRYSLKELEL